MFWKNILFTFVFENEQTEVINKYIEMKDRILELMNYLQMKPTSFANTTQIKLATLSQIINGRNNPSLEVIMKIHAAFNFLNLEWLLYGKGEMCNGEPPQSLFTEILPSKEIENQKNASEWTNDAENRKEIASTAPFEDIKQTDIEEIRYSERPVRKIKEIKIFYDDGTYETIVPQK